MLDNSLGIADTMATQVVTAMRVGGTYLKVSIVQGGIGDASRLPFKYFLVSTHCCTNT